MKNIIAQSKNTCHGFYLKYLLKYFGDSGHNSILTNTERVGCVEFDDLIKCNSYPYKDLYHSDFNLCRWNILMKSSYLKGQEILL